MIVLMILMVSNFQKLVLMLTVKRQKLNVVKNSKIQYNGRYLRMTFKILSSQIIVNGQRGQDGGNARNRELATVFDVDLDHLK